jgi:hypothetical protein
MILALEYVEYVSSPVLTKALDESIEGRLCS